MVARSRDAEFLEFEMLWGGVSFLFNFLSMI